MRGASCANFLQSIEFNLIERCSIAASPFRKFNCDSDPRFAKPHLGPELRPLLRSSSNSAPSQSLTAETVFMDWQLLIAIAHDRTLIRLSRSINLESPRRGSSLGSTLDHARRYE